MSPWPLQEPHIIFLSCQKGSIISISETDTYQWLWISCKIVFLSRWNILNFLSSVGSVIWLGVLHITTISVSYWASTWQTQHNNNVTKSKMYILSAKFYRRWPEKYAAKKRARCDKSVAGANFLGEGDREVHTTLKYHPPSPRRIKQWSPHCMLLLLSAWLKENFS